MSRARVWLVYLLMAVIVGGSLYDIVKDAEHWPFSSYPIYSYVMRDRWLVLPRLVGVTAEATPREIPLLAYAHIQPLDSSRLASILTVAPDRPDRQQILMAIARDCLDRYEALRRAGRHDGPPLQGIRVYEFHWQLDPWARNVDDPRPKVLLAQIMLPTAEGR